jgi:hypothetical protein
MHKKTVLLGGLSCGSDYGKQFFWVVGISANIAQLVSKINRMNVWRGASEGGQAGLLLVREKDTLKISRPNVTSSVDAAIAGPGWIVAWHLRAGLQKAGKIGKTSP